MKLTVLLCSALLLSFCGLSLEEKCGNPPRVPVEPPLQPPCGKFTGSICTMEYDPLCGTDGKTYSNPCRFCVETRGKRVRVKHRGACQPGPRPSS